MNNLADLLRKDYYIVCPNGKTVTSDYLHILKNYYKKQIYDALDGKTVGKTGLMWTNNLDVIFPCSIAMWELGVSPAMHNFALEVVVHPVFKHFYQGIDFVVAVGTAADQVFPELPHIPAVYSQLESHSYINQLPEGPIYQFLPNEYPDLEYTLDQPITDETAATTIYVKGINGSPGIIKISHGDACRIVKSNIDLFKFTESDRVLHTKSLYHGNLFLHYTIPALATTPTHYWTTMIANPYDRLNHLSTILNTCRTEHITKCLLPPNWTRELTKCPEVKLPNTSVLTIYGPEQDTVKKLFEKFDFKSIYNNFGCNEVGTIVAEETTKLNVERYRPNCFDIFNPLVDLDIQPGYFKAKLVTNAQWHTISDQVEIKDNIFIFHGTSPSITMNNVEINLNELNNNLATYLNTDQFSLIADYERSQLYLGFYNTKQCKTCDELFDALGVKISKTADFGSWYFGELTPTQFITPAVLLHVFQNQTVVDYRPK